ncbi:MAG: hypothetical protein ACFFFC_18045 [Candidatus Thorarchaeota archaeon]
MKVETAQRILWFAMLFVVIGIIFTIVLAFGAAAVTYLSVIDLAPFIGDPEVLAFIEANPGFIPFVIAILAVVEIVFLAIIYMWRNEPMAHRTGFTILGILMLFAGWSLIGFLILLPGLLLEEQ